MKRMLRRLAWWYILRGSGGEFPQVAHGKCSEFGTFYISHYSKPAS